MTMRFQAKWGSIRVKKMRQREIGISVLMKIRIEMPAG
jgi:hypothetical protein